jgi:metal-sulfur cluster biosynthetic enzyme
VSEQQTAEAKTEPDQTATTTTAAATTTTATAAAAAEVAAVDDVEEALRDVVDPELGINVVDLGLVYGLTVDEANVAIIDMTLTSAACPLQDEIENQIRSATSSLVNDFRVNWVWMPPWGPDKITDDGREQLRALGFNV